MENKKKSKSNFPWAKLNYGKMKRKTHLIFQHCECVGAKYPESLVYLKFQLFLGYFQGILGLFVTRLVLFHFSGPHSWKAKISIEFSMFFFSFFLTGNWQKRIPKETTNTHANLLFSQFIFQKILYSPHFFSKFTTNFRIFLHFLFIKSNFKI